MSDYFLNKIYDSLLSNKPVPKKPIVEKKEAKKFQPLSQIIAERYNIYYKKESEPQFNKVVVSDDQFKQAYRYLQVSDDVKQIASQKIIEAGLTSSQSNEIVSMALQYDNTDQFFKMLDSRMPINEFISQTNILDYVIKKYNLDPTFAKRLLAFQPATQPVTGKGETFILLTVEGAKKGAKGDVDISGTIYEIKGVGARIKGQKGFGSNVAVAKEFLNGLNVLIQQAGLNIKLENPNFNIAKKSNGIIDELAKELTQTGKVTKQDIVNIYSNGLSRYYEKSNATEIAKWVEQGLNDDGTLNNTFRSHYFTFAFQYYAKLEDFTYMIVIGTNEITKEGKAVKGFGMQKIISKADIISGNIFDKVFPGTYPSFTEGAGIQGGAFSIVPFF